MAAQPSSVFSSFARRLEVACDVACLPRDASRSASLAALLDLSVDTVRQWREGVAVPPADRAEALARQLGVAPEWLLHGRGVVIVGDGRLAPPMREQVGAQQSEEARLLQGFRALDARGRAALLALLESLAARDA